MLQQIHCFHLSLGSHFLPHKLFFLLHFDFSPVYSHQCNYNYYISMNQLITFRFSSTKIWISPVPYSLYFTSVSHCPSGFSNNKLQFWPRLMTLLVFLFDCSHSWISETYSVLRTSSATQKNNPYELISTFSTP